MTSGKLAEPLWARIADLAPTMGDRRPAAVLYRDAAYGRRADHRRAEFPKNRRGEPAGPMPAEEPAEIRSVATAHRRERSTKGPAPSLMEMSPESNVVTTPRPVAVRSAGRVSLPAPQSLALRVPDPPPPVQLQRFWKVG